MRVPIPTLRGTLTHATAVELYQCHRGDAGVCGRCGEPTPCPTRAHAAWVIVAAGEDPHWYDGRSSRPVTVPRPRRPDTDDRPTMPPDVNQRHPDRFGFAVLGRTAPMDPVGLLYEREQ